MNSEMTQAITDKNLFRASTAKVALAAYTELPGCDACDLDDNITDLMINLLHLWFTEGNRDVDVLGRVSRHFEVECTEPDEECGAAALAWAKENL